MVETGITTPRTLRKESAATAVISRNASGITSSRSRIR